MALVGTRAASASVYESMVDTAPRRIPSLETVYRPVSWTTENTLSRGQCDEGVDSAGYCADVGGSDDGCSCCADPGCWQDNLVFFLASDAWKTKADEDLSGNNFGFRFGFNSGWGISDGTSVRAQFGASYAAYDLSGRNANATNVVNPSSAEEQVFVTAGFYKRGNVCCGDPVSWGIVYDYLHDDNYGEEGDRIQVSQFRFVAGYATSVCNEFGVTGAIRLEDDVITSAVQGTALISSMDYVALYWKRNWAYGGDTTLLVGLADDPGDVLLGLRGTAPLSCNVALFGNFHYYIPSTGAGNVFPNAWTEDTWNVTFGLAFYPGGKASSDTVSGNAGLPLLPVADNGSFPTQAPLGNL